MSSIVFNAVFEFFFNAAAYLQAIFRRDRDIAAVKEGVHILPKENPIRYGVWSPFAVRFDVSRFENVQNG